MHKGSCLCGAICFELLSDPRAVSNCHCRMCQKQHGAAFATYASVPRADLKYLRGEDLLTAYNSSGSIIRKFCRVCGSHVEWSGSTQFPDWVSIPLTLLDTAFKPGKIQNIHVQSRAGWLPD